MWYKSILKVIIYFSITYFRFENFTEVTADALHQRPSGLQMTKLNLDLQTLEQLSSRHTPAL